MLKFICVSGNIASGKTTLVAGLSRVLKWEAIYEDLSQHLYFADFYKDARKWSFHNQTFFLIQSLEIQMDLARRTDGVCVCQDFSLFERHLYSEMMREQGLMEKRDFDTCTRLYHAILQVGRRPDCIVYLGAPTSVLLQRIKSRGREAEQMITLDYINALDARYEAWYSSRTDSRVLKIDSNIHDLNNPKVIRHLGKQILAEV